MPTQDPLNTCKIFTTQNSKIQKVRKLPRKNQPTNEKKPFWNIRDREDSSKNSRDWEKPASKTIQ